MFDFDPTTGIENEDELDPYRGMSEEELIREARVLHELRCRVEADEALLLGEVERRRLTQASPHRDTAAWYRRATGAASSSARTRAEVARQLSHLPQVHTDLALGRITFDHARYLATEANSRNRDQVLDDERHLARLAREHTADEFRELLAEWARDLDEQRDVQDSDIQKQRRRRSVRRWRGRDGMNKWLLSLDDEADAVLSKAVRDVVAEEQRHERKDPPGPGQRRTTEQRWADAALEVALRSRGADALSKRKARPTIIAVTQLEKLWADVTGLCELSDGTQLTARQLRRLACEADIIPMVLDSNGVVLDMGRKVRLATENQRYALRATHKACAVEGCTVPFEWCEVHHLNPWEKGGRSDLANLVPLCSYHHGLVHDAAWPHEVLPNRKVRLLDYFADVRRRRATEPRPPDRVPAR